MGVLTQVLDVFSGIGTWFASAIQALIPMFYVASGDDAGLTFLGVLSCASVGIGVIMLLVNTICDFIGFRKG